MQRIRWDFKTAAFPNSPWNLPSWFSYNQSPISLGKRSTFPCILLCWNHSRTEIAFNRFLAIFETCIAVFCLCFVQWISLKSLLNYSNSFHGRMSKFRTKLDADLPWKMHTFTQWRLNPDWLTPKREYLFTHAHYGPLWLFANLHHSRVSCSLDIPNDWIISGHTSYTTSSNFLTYGVRLNF